MSLSLAHWIQASEAGSLLLLTGFLVKILKYCKTNDSVEQRVFTQQNSVQGNMECLVSASISRA